MTNSLKERRGAQLLTQDQQADRAGVSQQAVSQIERGSVLMPNAEAKILDVLDALEAENGRNGS